MLDVDLKRRQAVGGATRQVGVSNAGETTGGRQVWIVEIQKRCLCNNEKGYLLRARPRIGFHLFSFFFSSFRFGGADGRRFE